MFWLKSSIIPEQCYYVCEEVTDDAEDTHKHVILYPDQVTASQVGGRKRRHEQLLWLPVVSAPRSDLASADGRQLPALRLHHLVLGDVLDCLKLNQILF